MICSDLQQNGRGELCESGGNAFPLGYGGHESRQSILYLRPFFCGLLDEKMSPRRNAAPGNTELRNLNIEALERAPCSIIDRHRILGTEALTSRCVWVTGKKASTWMAKVDKINLLNYESTM
ncbi:hypothetical protein NC651_019998 [Populus alba x Populus x berolinensis]|nr:hypothetical protein NC651_019998 [Populus alba x Populus x berolinensis]